MAAVLRVMRHPSSIYLSCKDSLTTPLSNRVASCTNALKQFHASYLNSESLFRKSIAGRVIFGLGFEMIGAAVGASIGASLMGAMCRRLSPGLVAAGIIGALYPLRNRVTLVATSALCMSCGMCVLGTNVGMILGGYAGLALLGSRVTLWDRTDLGDTYGSAMARSVFAGIACPLPLMRQVAQTIAYHWGSVTTILGGFFRERKFKQEVVIPLIVKSFCDRYCEDNAQHFTNCFVRILSSTFRIIPWMEGLLGLLLRLQYSQSLFRNTIDKIKENSHKITAALMRSFVQYVELVQETHKNKEELKKKFSWLLLSATNRVYLPQSLAESILKAIQEAGIDLYGSPILIDIAKHQPLLKMHISCFLVFFLKNLDFRDLEQQEEQAFCIKLIDAFTSLLDQNCSSHTIMRLLGKGLQGAIPLAYLYKERIRRLIEPPEQTVWLECCPQLPEELEAVVPFDDFGSVGDDFEMVSQEQMLPGEDDYKIEGFEMVSLEQVLLAEDDYKIAKFEQPLTIEEEH